MMLRSQTTLRSIDQAIFSATNAVPVLLIARRSTAEEFGRIAIVLTAVLLTNGLIRSLAAQPLTLLFRRDGDLAPTAFGALGVAARIAALMAVVALGLGALMGIGTVTSLLLAAVVGVYAIEDTQRFLLMGQDRAGTAAALDFGWFVVTLGGMFMPGSAGAAGPLAMWLCGALFAAVAGHRLLGNPGFADVGFRAEASFVGSRLMIDWLAQAAPVVFILNASGLISLAAAAAFRGSQTVLGPGYTLFQSLILAVLITAVDLRADLARRSRILIMVSVVGSVAILAAGAVLLVVPGLGDALLGPRVWESARPVLLPYAASLAATASLAGAAVALKADQRVELLMRLRWGTAVLAIAATTIGLVVGSTVLAAWLLAGAFAISSPAWWVAAARTVSDPVPALG